MSIIQPTATILIVAAACALMGCDDTRTSAADSENRQKVEQAWIPEPAREAILEEAEEHDARISHIETVTPPEGGTLYRATLRSADKTTLLTVDGEGDVVGERPLAVAPLPQPSPLVDAPQVVTLDALPDPARATVLKHVKAEEIRRIEQVMVGGKLAYDVTAQREGTVTSLCVGASGDVVRGATTVADHPAHDDRVPERVRAAIIEKSGGTAVRDVRTIDARDGKAVYEVTLDRRDYVNDFVVDRDGHLLADMRVHGDLALDDVPAAPRATLIQMAGKGTIRQVEHADDAGRELYTAVVDREATADRERKTQRVTVDRSGRLVSRRTVKGRIDRSELINPAAAKVDEQVGERHIRSIEVQEDGGRTLYEVKVDDDVLTKVFVDENGRVVHR